MKLETVALDDTDTQILELLQEDCKRSLADIGERVGMSAPSVIERIRKLEAAGVIRGYTALVDARRVGLDVAAFIGVTINFPKKIAAFEREVRKMREVLECHHITGDHTLLIKVRTYNTASLEQVISRLRTIDGVDRTHTMVVLSTINENGPLLLRDPQEEPGEPQRRKPRSSRREAL
jgi:Lrp/AsnC family leucine-responsive transcriptional regulator